MPIKMNALPNWCNLAVVYDENGRAHLAKRESKNIFLFDFRNELLMINVLPQKGNNKDILHFAVITKSDDEVPEYYLEEIFFDVRTNKHYEVLLGVSKEIPFDLGKGLNNIYGYRDIDGNYCLFDFNTGINVSRDEAVKYLKELVLSKYLGKDIFYEELSHNEDEALFIAIDERGNASNKRSLSLFSINLKFKLDCYDKRIKGMTLNKKYVKAEWVDRGVYQVEKVSKDASSICFISVNNKEIQVCEIEKDIRNHLKKYGSKVVSIEIGQCTDIKKFNSKIRRVIIGFENGRRMYFNLEVDVNNVNDYKVYNSYFIEYFGTADGLFCPKFEADAKLDRTKFFDGLSRLRFVSDDKSLFNSLRLVTPKIVPSFRLSHSKIKIEEEGLESCELDAESNCFDPYSRIRWFLGENTFWEELPQQDNCNSEDLERLYKSNSQEIPMKEFITISAIVNFDYIPAKNVLLKIKVNLNKEASSVERKFEIIKLPALYEDAEWICNYMYQVVERSKDGHSICLVSVKDEGIKVNRIEQDIRAFLRYCGEKVINIELMPFRYMDKSNLLIRELVISFSNFKKLYFIVQLDKDNLDGYKVYNIVYGFGLDNYQSVLSQSCPENSFLDKDVFLRTLKELSLSGDGRKITQVDFDTVDDKLKGVSKKLCLRKL